MSPSGAIDRLLAAHPKNVEVRYDKVVRARFNAGISGLTIPMVKLWTDRGKVFFAFMRSAFLKDRTQVQLAKQLLSRTLGERVVFRHV